MKAYLDNAATTNVTKHVYDAMKPYFKKHYGNPSSLHDKGIENKKIINQSKREIASLLHCDYKEIYFTSCGTESINWAIKGLALANQTKFEIITTKVEHHATLHTCEFLERNRYVVHYLDVDELGFVNLDQLKSLINENTLLVSIIYANNEIGTIQNIPKIKEICDAGSTYLHIDAVQVPTHIPLNLKELDADLVSMSGHKFHAPKGIGMLYIKDGIKIENLLHGGQQENDHRSGTENVPYIIGMTEALKRGISKFDKHYEHVTNLAKLFLKKLDKANIDYLLNGPEIGPERHPGILNVSFKDIDGNDLVFELNKRGVYVSTGSACDFDRIDPSHVIQAIGVPLDYIEGTIRFSIGDQTTEEEILYAVEQVIEIIKE